MLDTSNLQSLSKDVDKNIKNIDAIEKKQNNENLLIKRSLLENPKKLIKKRIKISPLQKNCLQIT